MPINLQGIALTLNDLAVPGMKPKALLKAVRERHPEASKKDVVRAAFYSVIAHAGDDAERADRLHDFAIQSRSGMDEAQHDEAPAEKTKRKSRRAKG